jgi:hypothetical protein
MLISPDSGLNLLVVKEQTYLVSQDEIADIRSLVEGAGREGAQAGALHDLACTVFVADLLLACRDGSLTQYKLEPLL